MYGVGTVDVCMYVGTVYVRFMYGVCAVYVCKLVEAKAATRFAHQHYFEKIVAEITPGSTSQHNKFHLFFF